MKPSNDPDFARTPQRPSYDPSFNQPIQQPQPAPQATAGQPQQPYTANTQPVQPASTAPYGAQPQAGQQPVQGQPYRQPSVRQPQSAAGQTNYYGTAPNAGTAGGPQPIHASGGQFGGDSFAPADKPRRSRRKIVLISLLVVLLLAGAAAAYAFLIYLPNRPNAVYSTGLSRTGMAVDKLLAGNATAKDLTSFENSRLSGDVKVTGPEATYSGTFDSKYDKNQTDTTIGYKTDGATANTSNDLSLRLLTDLKEGSVYPDTYFRLTGLKSLGLESMVPGINAYDGKWISVTGDYIASLIPVPTTADTTTKQDFSSEDAVALAKVAADTTRQYVFTDDPSKAVLERREFKGTEKTEEGITANHYKVGINRQHAKDYCKALITNITSADAFKRIPNIDADQLLASRGDAIKSCQESLDKDLKDSDTFDMWVDKKTKLIHKIRFTDEKDATTYLDVGQTYSGKGNELPFFARMHSDKEKFDVVVKFSVDIPAKTTKGSVEAKFEASGAWKVAANFTFKPNGGDVKVDKPAGTIPVQDMLKQLGIPIDETLGGSASGTGAIGIQASAQDTERITDIKSIQGQLEAVYASKGYYPSLAELNSATWRAANMKGLDSSALVAPGASGSPTLVAISTLTAYAYRPSGCSGGSTCSGYILEALLTTGEKRTLESLNA